MGWSALGDFPVLTLTLGGLLGATGAWLALGVMRRGDTSKPEESWQASEPAPQPKPVAPEPPPTTEQPAPAPIRSDAARVDALPISSIPGGFMLVDCQRRIVAANQECVEMFGYPDSQALIGHETSVLYANPDEALLMRSRVNRQAAISNVLLQGRRADGTTFWIEVSAALAQPGHPERSDLHVSLRDVSSHIALETSLADARREAERAAAMRSQFLARMSHEMRTPMNAIIGLSHLTLRTQLDEQQNDFVTKIHEAGTGLLGIINEVLDLAKIEAGKTELSEGEASIEQILRRVANLVGPQLGKKPVELMFRLSETLPRVIITDALRLQQIILNLVSNAAKFTQEGEIIVDVNCDSGVGNELQLFVSVSDSGIGITEQQAERLFDQFNQGGADISQRFGGTGLGLAISKSLIEAMGGSISVAGTPGVGSTFTFSIKSRRPLHETAHTVIRSAVPVQRVLVIDDNEIAREVLASMLNRFVEHVEVATGGADALTMLEQADPPFDCVFLDWKMPDLDGVETGLRIRNQIGHPQPRLIMMTAFNIRELRNAASQRALASDLFLAKPVTPSDVYETLLSLGSSPVDSRSDATSINDTPVFDGVRILLVEDNEINQQLALELIKLTGAITVLAENGQVAIDTLNDDDAFDLVLMDIQMPIIDGIEATRQIRNQPRWKDLPIVALTANAMREDRDLYLGVGMQDCVTKPIDPDELYRAIDRWRQGISAQDENRDDAGQPAQAASAAPVPAPVVAGSSFPDMPGIDVGLALKRVAGRADVYARLLRRTVENYADLSARLRELIAAGDMTTAHREAHSMKGVSGNIGAEALFEASYKLEQALKRGNPVKNELATFEQTLETTLDALRDGLERYQAPEKSGVGGDAVAILQQLKSLLDVDDMAAAGHAHEHAATLSAAFGDDTAAQLLNQIDDFDFEAARSLLRHSATAAGMSLE